MRERGERESKKCSHAKKVLSLTMRVLFCHFCEQGLFWSRRFIGWKEEGLREEREWDSHSFSGWKIEGRMPLERRIPLTVECAFLIDSEDSSFLEKNKCMKKRQRIWSQERIWRESEERQRREITTGTFHSSIHFKCLNRTTTTVTLFSSPIWSLFTTFWCEKEARRNKWYTFNNGSEKLNILLNHIIPSQIVFHFIQHYSSSNFCTHLSVLLTNICTCFWHHPSCTFNNTFTSFIGHDHCRLIQTPSWTKVRLFDIHSHRIKKNLFYSNLLPTSRS